MLQQPARPSGNVQLPYTTADMAERLAKRKAAKDRQDILDSLSGGLSYGQGGVDITPQLSQIGGMVKGLVQMPAATIMDIASGIVRPLDKYVGGVKDPVDQYRPEDYGTSNLITGTAQGLEQAGRRAVGDITAIPYVGKPSPSPTATDIKRLGVIEGLSKAGIDYGNLALTAAPFVKPSAWGISNAYQDMLEARLAYKNRSPFPTVKTPGSVIDVDALQGSRLPARIVDTPATPTTRLAEAQTQRALPPAQVAPIEVAPTTSRLTPPAFRERPVPTSSRLTVQLQGEKFGDGTPMLHKNQHMTIRSFDQATGEYTGVITIFYNAQTKKALVDGMSATNPMVTPQLIAAAASEVRKIVGNVQYPLTPSASLSAYSRPFVERLQQAGLIDPDYQLPKISNLNSVTKVSGPEAFASAQSGSSSFGGAFLTSQEVINPLSYQPTYNQILQSLIQSRRQAKLAGEYGRLATPSAKLAPKRNSLINEMVNIEEGFDPWSRQPSEIDEISDFDEFNPSYAFDPIAVIDRPVRIAEFIRNNVDPNNPLLKYYLDQYGSIENFATSGESFGMINFMRPFYGQEPL